MHENKTLNRTLVELKCTQDYVMQRARKSLNRTLVELKSMMHTAQNSRANS